MANPTNNPEPEVRGKDLLTRGLDFLFGKLGDAVHGATQGKEVSPIEGNQAAKKVVETTGTSEEDTTPNGQAPSEEADGKEDEQAPQTPRAT